MELESTFGGLLTVAIFLAAWATMGHNPSRKMRTFLWAGAFILGGISFGGLVIGVRKKVEPSSSSAATHNVSSINQSGGVVAEQIGTLNMKTIYSVATVSNENEKKERHKAREMISEFINEGLKFDGYARGVNLKAGQNWIPEYEKWEKTTKEWTTTKLGASYAEEFIRPNTENLPHIKRERFDQMEPQYQGQGMSESIRSQIRYLRSVQDKLDEGKIDVIKADEAISPKLGDDNTIVGTLPAGSIGSGNTIVNSADANGNVIFNKGGTAIGNGAEAGPT